MTIKNHAKKFKLKRLLLKQSAKSSEDKGDENNYNGLMKNFKTKLLNKLGNALQNRQKSFESEMNEVQREDLSQPKYPLLKRSATITSKSIENIKKSDLSQISPNEPQLIKISSRHINEEERPQAAKTLEKRNTSDLNKLKIKRGLQRNFSKQFKIKQRQYVQNLRTKIDVVSVGDVFGEIGVFTTLHRTATVLAREHSVFQTIHRDDIQKIKQKYPNVFNKLEDDMYCYMDEDMT